MEENNLGASPTEEPAPVTPVVASSASPKNKKLWIIIGVMAAIIILILGLGGFFVMNILSDDDTSSGQGTTLLTGGNPPVEDDTLPPTDDTPPQPDDTPPQPDDTPPQPDDTPPTPGTTTPDGPSIDDLLNNPEDYVSPVSGGSVSGEVTSIVCSASSVEATVKMVSGVTSGVSFKVSDGSGVFKTWVESAASIAEGSSKSFTIDISAGGLDVATTSLEAFLLLADGSEVVVPSIPCP